MLEIKRLDSIMMDIKYEVAELSEVSFVSEFVNSIFGPNPKSIEIFSKWINESNYHVTTAKLDSKIIGVSSSYFNEHPTLEKYIHFGERAVEFLRDQKVGWFLTLAVSPEFRKHRIGWNLAKKHFNWLKNQSCARIVGSSWITGSSDNSEHIFIKAGFEKLGESHEFLRSQLVQTGSTCSACGKIECECLSILYGKVIEN